MTWKLPKNWQLYHAENVKIAGANEGDMKPEEINRWIAEKVMGWPNQHHTTLAVANFDPYHRIEHAIMALEKSASWQLSKYSDTHYQCFVNDENYHTFVADTPSAAICLALFEAVKGE